MFRFRSTPKRWPKARLVHEGDLVIIISYGMMDDAEARALKPRVVHVDGDNRIVALGDDAAEPVPGSDQKRVVPIR